MLQQGCQEGCCPCLDCHLSGAEEGSPRGVQEEGEQPCQGSSASATSHSSASSQCLMSCEHQHHIETPTSASNMDDALIQHWSWKSAVLPVQSQVIILSLLVLMVCARTADGWLAICRSTPVWSQVIILCLLVLMVSACTADGWLACCRSMCPWISGLRRHAPSGRGPPSTRYAAMLYCCLVLFCNICDVFVVTEVSRDAESPF